MLMIIVAMNPSEKLPFKALRRESFLAAVVKVLLSWIFES
jgi:hypothetical protein